jgi:hypothetical protein
MKSEQNTLDLIRCHLDGEASDEECRELQEKLRRDPAARRLFARYANIDAMLGEGCLPACETSLPGGAALPRSPAWRPLSAAAAGLVVGLFSATLVLGFSGGLSGGVMRTGIQVADADFERDDITFDRDFPSRPQIWAVDDAEVSAVESGGKALRLDPRPKYPFSRAVQVVEVGHAAAGTKRSLELSAKFRKTERAHGCRYKLRLIGFEEDADKLRPFPIGKSDQGIVSSYQTIDVLPGADGWHRLSTMMPLPPEVKTVVVWLGGSTWPHSGAKVSHLVDDVRLEMRTVE